MENLESEKKRDGVLLVATPMRLLAIDLARLRVFNPIEYGKSRMPAPPVLKEFNLVANGLPFGMRFFVCESKLYMVGGEKPSEGVPAKELFFPINCPLDESFGVGGASPYIYVSDVNSLDSITDFHRLSTAMLGPKPNPFIGVVEGKIYVLSGKPYHYRKDDPQFPTFEVYDPSVGEWEALPDPPFYNPRSSMYEMEYVVGGLSVVGSTIYVKSGRSNYSYDVNSKIWNSLGWSAYGISIPLPLLPRFIGKFVPAYDDIFIGLSRRTLFAALIPRDGSPPTYQSLTEVFGDYFYRDIEHTSGGAVVELGEQEMCIIKTGWLLGSRTVAYIATFKVEKLPSSAQDLPLDNCQCCSPVPVNGQDQRPGYWPVPLCDQLVPDGLFLSVTCLTKGLYDLEAWGIDVPTVSCAYFPVMVCLLPTYPFYHTLLCIFHSFWYLFCSIFFTFVTHHT